MYNIKREADGLLMLGSSLETLTEAHTWLSYYNNPVRNLQKHTFSIVDNAPPQTCDLPLHLLPCKGRH